MIMKYHYYAKYFRNFFALIHYETTIVKNQFSTTRSV